MSRSSLDVLERLKQHAVDGTTAELSERVGDAERAAHERARAADVLAKKQTEAARTEALEQSKLDSGELRAGDLARAADYRRGALIEQRGAERDLSQAQTREQKRRAALEVARSALAEARAEEKAVRKLVDERRQEDQAARGGAEELDAEDLYNARRRTMIGGGSNPGGRSA